MRTILGVLMILLPASLAAQTNCGAWGTVTSWTGSYTVTTHTSGTSDAGETYTYDSSATTSGQLLLPDSAIPCYWQATGAGTSSSGSFTGTATYSCISATYSGSGPLTADSSMYIFLDANA